ncbi:MAG: MBL fold metallo-hydrolase [Verrucomicrobia bacterium]|nr:MBL fold metallo-hydrolase [Verrucomicrobiota bacterium]
MQPATLFLTTLVENTAHGRGLQGEHGLSFHLHSGGRSLVFDTGQSALLLKNADTLGVDLSGLDAIVLSHGHYDHTGGLPAVRDRAPRARLYLHPAALEPKFAGNPDGTSRPVGMEDAALQVVRQAGDSVVWTTQPTEILDGIFVTGEIPRQTAYEDTGGPFYLDAACRRADPLVDDQALFFDTKDGLVVVLGCAHAGVVNTLLHVQHVAPNRPIAVVVGGFHLLAAGEERMTETVAALGRWNLRRLAAGHCTGTAAVVRLWSAFPGRCASCAVGTRMAFER